MDPEGVRAARIWIAACSHRLQRRWRTVAPEQLEEVAETLWADERLPALDPDIAAAEWLRRGDPRPLPLIGNVAVGQAAPP